jgi:hypothetical protein
VANLKIPETRLISGRLGQNPKNFQGPCSVGNLKDPKLTAQIISSLEQNPKSFRVCSVANPDKTFKTWLGSGGLEQNPKSFRGLLEGKSLKP